MAISRFGWHVCCQAPGQTVGHKASIIEPFSSTYLSSLFLVPLCLKVKMQAVGGSMPSTFKSESSWVCFVNDDFGFGNASDVALYLARSLTMLYRTFSPLHTRTRKPKQSRCLMLPQLSPQDKSTMCPSSYVNGGHRRMNKEHFVAVHMWLTSS